MKRNKVSKRFNKYFGEGAWDKVKDVDKEVFIKEGAYVLYKLKELDSLPDLQNIGALKSPENEVSIPVEKTTINVSSPEIKQ